MTGKDSSSASPTPSAPTNPPADLKGKPCLRLHDVWVRRDGRDILQDVCLGINYGDFVAVTGPNGGGKTTLLRVILGLVKPSEGTVQRFAHDGRQLKRLSVGYLPQKNLIDSHFPISVREVVASGLLGTKGLSRQECRQRVDSTIAQMGLQTQADRPIGILSGGQLQRALLGRALISRPAVLVLDEPLSYLDKHYESRLYEILSQQSAAGTTIILVSHELSTIDAMANRHLIVDHSVHECAATHHGVITTTDCD